MGGGAGVGWGGGRCRAARDYHPLCGQFRLPLPVVAAVLHPAPPRLVADRDDIPVVFSAGPMHRPAPVLGVGELADRALFHLGQLRLDPQSGDRPAECAVRGEGVAPRRLGEEKRKFLTQRHKGAKVSF